MCRRRRDCSTRPPTQRKWADEAGRATVVLSKAVDHQEPAVAQQRGGEAIVHAGQRVDQFRLPVRRAANGKVAEVWVALYAVLENEPTVHDASAIGKRPVRKLPCAEARQIPRKKTITPGEQGFPVIRQYAATDERRVTCGARLEDNGLRERWERKQKQGKKAQSDTLVSHPI